MYTYTVSRGAMTCKLLFLFVICYTKLLSWYGIVLERSFVYVYTVFAAFVYMYTVFEALVYVYAVFAAFVYIYLCPAGQGHASYGIGS